MPTNEWVERTSTPFVIGFRYLCIDNNYMKLIILSQNSHRIYRQREILGL